MTDVPNPVPSPVEGQRSFGLNSPEAYEALCPPPDPWRWGPGLPRDSRWERRDDPVLVWVEDEADAPTAFQDWQWRVETGRIG